MKKNSRRFLLQPPKLCDECAVEIHEFLFKIERIFESRFGAQINRYYQQRSHKNLLPPDPRQCLDDPPF